MSILLIFALKSRRRQEGILTRKDQYVIIDVTVVIHSCDKFNNQEIQMGQFQGSEEDFWARGGNQQEQAPSNRSRRPLEEPDEVVKRNFTPIREHRNHKERGKKKFSFTYEDIAVWTGFSLGALRQMKARKVFDPTNLLKLSLFVVKWSILNRPEIRLIIISYLFSKTQLPADFGVTAE